jgi:hypothetical protein
VSSLVLLSQTRVFPASVDIRRHPLTSDILLCSTPVGAQKNREYDVVLVSGEEVIKKSHVCHTIMAKDRLHRGCLTQGYYSGMRRNIMRFYSRWVSLHGMH